MGYSPYNARYNALTVTALLTCLGGCTSFSAPVPFQVHETARTVGKGLYRIQVAGGAGIGSSGWPGGAVGGALKIRRGLDHEHELGVSAYALAADSFGDVETGYPSNLAVSAKLDHKWGLRQGLALLTGAGGGFTELGAALGADMGLVTSPSWKRFIPYGAARLGISVPLDQRGIIKENKPPDTPSATMFLLGAGGFLVPVREVVALSFEGGVSGLFTRPENGIALYASVAASFTY